MIAAIREKIRQDGEYKLGRWGTFWHRFAIANWRWSIALCKFEDHWSLHLFCLWVRLWKTRNEPEDMMESWGFTYDPEMRALHLNWRRTKVFWMPWSYDHCRTEVMVVGQRFVPEDSPEAAANRYSVVLPYRYVRESGEVQCVDATVTVERRAWCWRAWPFSWLRWPSKGRMSIEVQFSDEVGEGAGSWKGGCIGCGYEMLPNEPPEQCLRRMESERKFRR